MAIKQVIRNLVSRKRSLTRILDTRSLDSEEKESLRSEIAEIDDFLQRFRSSDDSDVSAIRSFLNRRRTEIRKGFRADTGDGTHLKRDIKDIGKKDVNKVVNKDVKKTDMTKTDNNDQKDGILAKTDKVRLDTIDYMLNQIRQESSKSSKEGKVDIKSQAQTKDRFFRTAMFLDMFHKKEFGRNSQVFSRQYVFSKKNLIIMLAILVLLNIFIRLPNFPNEYGVDSFYIHYYSQSVIDNGYADWVAHPLSLVGMYPLEYSYPSFVPMLLSYLSVMTGIQPTMLIMIQAILMGVLSVFTSFMFAREFSGSDLIAYFTAFAFSLAPIFVKFTIWTTPARALFMVLLPLALYFLLRWNRTGRTRYLFFFLLIVLVEAMTHRIFIFILIFLVPAFVLAKLFALLQEHFSGLFQRRLYLYLILAMIGLFTLQFSNIGFFEDQKYDYASGFFFDQLEEGNFNEDSANQFYIFINLMVDYASRVGLMSLFMLVGIFILLTKLKNQTFTFNELFIMFFLTAGKILFMKGKYINIFYLIVFSLLAGIGLEKVLVYFSYRKKVLARIMPAMLILFMFFSLFFTIFMFNHWVMVGIDEEEGLVYPWKSLKTDSGFSYLDAVNTEQRFVQVAEAPLNFRFYSSSTKTAFIPNRITYSRALIDMNVDIGAKLPVSFYVSNLADSYVYDGIDNRWGLISADPRDYHLEEDIDRLHLGYIYQNKFNPNYDTWSMYSSLEEHYDKIYDNTKEEAWKIY